MTLDWAQLISALVGLLALGYLAGYTSAKPKPPAGWSKEKEAIDKAGRR